MPTTEEVERGRSLVAILITGESVRLAPDHVTESDFRSLTVHVGDEVQKGEPIYGYCTSGDFVYIPARSVLYLRGLK